MFGWAPEEIVWENRGIFTSTPTGKTEAGTANREMNSSIENFLEDNYYFLSTAMFLCAQVYCQNL